MHLPWRGRAFGDGPSISTSLTDDETAALRRLARIDALEVGSAFGYSTVAMALSGAHVTSVDPHVTMRSLSVFEANLAAYQVTDRVDLHVRRSEDALSDLLADGRTFDLAFVDGDHTQSVVEHDVTLAVKLLRQGGVLACHDYGEDCCCPGVRAALDRLFPAGPDELVDTLFVVRP